MTHEEIIKQVDEIKIWAYKNCRSDIGADHAQGIKIIEDPFKALYMLLGKVINDAHTRGYWDGVRSVRDQLEKQKKSKDEHK